ncbi:alpha/beta fold hydrolase [Curtobacterium herbarum]|uniref:Alpha/beta hydrolase n=1 Tax=Curtobacterium herbarum TaxID=150122 RepID=A0ABP4K3J7_9MICO|nr:alpha/beta hydrolase [Curtobacterium herbarum]MBM7475695.1 pimeloyl-ACP methyl ester carboxylesterase [Curtobacterium herbarum]MCS6543607.1 alpha/beta hydrolase [Curtobacterium herbarum]
MSVTDTGAVPQVRTVHPDAYAPYPVVDDPDRWGLTTTTVPSSAGPTVVHHRPGPRPLLFLHGVAGSWTTWTPLLSAADGVAGRGLVLVDLPGWGSSPAPAVPLDVDESSQVLVDVLDALGLDRVDVVGHSMGAFVGLHLAVTRPERVRSLGLVSGTTFATAAAARRPVRALRTLPAFTLLRAGLGVTRGAARGLLRGLARIGLLPLLAGPVFAAVRQLPASVLQAFVDEFRPAGFLGAARSAAHYDTGRWSAVRCPVVAIAGRQDVFARVDDLARLRAVLPDVRTVLVEDCGHFAHVERPDAVVRELFS